MFFISKIAYLSIQCLEYYIKIYAVDVILSIMVGRVDTQKLADKTIRKEVKVEKEVGLRHMEMTLSDLNKF